MRIIVNLDVVMAQRKMSSKELAQAIGITEANLSLLKSSFSKEHFCREHVLEEFKRIFLRQKKKHFNQLDKRYLFWISRLELASLITRQYSYSLLSSPSNYSFVPTSPLPLWQQVILPPNTIQPRAKGNHKKKKKKYFCLYFVQAFKL